MSADRVGGIDRVENSLAINAQATINVLPKQLIRWAKRGDVTPSVMNVEKLEFRNLTPLLVTNFDDGQPGQTITVLGDGQTTIEENTKIANVSGIDTLLAVGTSRDYTMFSNRKWYEKQ